jgi:soluble lytic murein transglycosylase-like protein
MASRSISSPFTRAAVSLTGGCPPGYFLAPLAVLLVGAVMMFFSLGMTFPSLEAESQPGQVLDMQAASQNPSISPVFTEEVQYWAAKIQIWASQAGLDPNLVATVMQIESCGDPRALSRSGAIGLFQVMPYHFTDTDDPYAPDTNALRGMDYLRRSWEAAHGDARLALAGYNGGIGVIGWSESAWPEQTRRYAYWGSGIYTEAASGATTSARLQEWLAANGLYLCTQAGARLGIKP